MSRMEIESNQLLFSDKPLLFRNLDDQSEKEASTNLYLYWKDEPNIIEIWGTDHISEWYVRAMVTSYTLKDNKVSKIKIEVIGKVARRK